MPIPIDIENFIEIARISGFLQGDDENNFIKNQGGVFLPKNSRALYIVRKSVEWLYDVDETDERLTDSGVYMKALCGAYALKAQGIIGSAGGIFVNPVTGQNAVIQPLFIQFTIGAIGELMSAGDTVLTLNYTGVIENSESVVIDNADIPRGTDLDRIRYTIAFNTTNFVITFNQAAIDGQLYVIRALRYITA
jgi:hypothetical protein